MMKDCPSRKANGGSVIGEEVCYGCNGKGHRKDQCPTANPALKGSQKGGKGCGGDWQQKGGKGGYGFGGKGNKGWSKEVTKEEAKAKEDSDSVEKEKAEEYMTLTCGGVKEVQMIGMDGQEDGTTAQ